jgi:hypothetical protein
MRRMSDRSPPELLTWLRANTFPGDSLDEFRAMPLDDKLELVFLLHLHIGRSVVDLERAMEDAHADNRRAGPPWLVDLWRRLR